MKSGQYQKQFQDIQDTLIEKYISENREKITAINELNTYENFLSQMKEGFHNLNQQLIDHLSNGYEVILKQIEEDINLGG